MKRQLVLCFVAFVVVSGSMFIGPDGNVMAQDSRDVLIATPLAGNVDPIKGPADGIFALEIRDGLKRVLLADLFATHGQYDQALEIVDYTKPVMVLDRELAVEKDPELIQLLKYQRQKIEATKDVRIATPIAIPLDPTRGPAEGILVLEIRDGLKRFLLADLFAQHGHYDQALEIVNYTKLVTILNKELAVEKDPELIRLLEYQRQKIGKMPFQPRAVQDLKQQADARYHSAQTYQNFSKYEQAIQDLLEALSMYQQLGDIGGQLLVRYQLAIVYKAIGKNEEALQQAQEFLKLEQKLELVKKIEEMQELVKELGGKTTTN